MNWREPNFLPAASATSVITSTDICIQKKVEGELWDNTYDEYEEYEDEE